MEEIDANIFEQVQIIARTNTKKPPTRLQKQAPASLQVTNYCTNNPYKHSIGTVSSPHTPIPLLSPLIVSPTPISQEAGEFRFPEVGVDMDKNCDTDKGCSMRGRGGGGGEGWQHPAVANVYRDPSSLFAVFQSKCVLVNHVQSEAS